MTPYQEYLLSDHWKALRSEKLNQNKTCERCRSTVALQVHHKFYRESWLDTIVDDLETLCPKCHRRTHGRNCAIPTENLQDAHRKGYLSRRQLKKLLKKRTKNWSHRALRSPVITDTPAQGTSRSGRHARSWLGPSQSSYAVAPMITRIPPYVNAPRRHRNQALLPPEACYHQA